jgi:cyclopropane fatty-acyl-phospholipid synthase-like methyltransferase
MNHLGGYIPEGDKLTYMPDVWQYLVDKFSIKSVLDIGCGTGKNLEWFKDCTVLGVEGEPLAVSLCRVPVRQHDYTQGPLTLEQYFDLCICTEFVEHVESKYEDNWFATMKSSGLVLMCHALPGQGGHHHVNCQDSDYWIKRFADNGFEKTSEVDQFVDKNVPYGKNTLILFERK